MEVTYVTETDPSGNIGKFVQWFTGMTEMTKWKQSTCSQFTNLKKSAIIDCTFGSSNLFIIS